MSNFVKREQYFKQMNDFECRLGYPNISPRNTDCISKLQSINKELTFKPLINGKSKDLRMNKTSMLELMNLKKPKITKIEVNQNSDEPKKISKDSMKIMNNSIIQNLNNFKLKQMIKESLNKHAHKENIKKILVPSYLSMSNNVVTNIASNVFHQKVSNLDSIEYLHALGLLCGKTRK